MQKRTTFLEFSFEKYGKAENVQRSVCFVNVKVVKWLHLQHKTLGFWSLDPTPIYIYVKLWISHLYMQMLPFLHACTSDIISSCAVNVIKKIFISKVLIHRKSSSIKGRLPSKAVFHQRLSSIRGCLQLLYQMCSRMAKTLFLRYALGVYGRKREFSSPPRYLGGGTPHW